MITNYYQNTLVSNVGLVAITHPIPTFAAKITPKRNKNPKTSPHLIVRLDQHLVVLAQGDEEHDGSDVLEAVNPLASLRALPADVNHAEDDGVQVEGILDDARRRNSNTQNILQRWQVIGQ